MYFGLHLSSLNHGCILSITVSNYDRTSGSRCAIILVQPFTTVRSPRSLIPMTGSFGDLVTYQNENGEYMKLTAGATVDRVHLMLRDEKGRTVDLQDQSWLIELEII